MHSTIEQSAHALSYNDADFDNGQQVIAALMDSLQRKFKHDTRYDRPLLSPHVNTVFALDEEAANNMLSYMSAMLARCGFSQDEFNFTRRSGAEGAGLQRLRLEFVNGVTFETIRRISLATVKIENLAS